MTTEIKDNKDNKVTIDNKYGDYAYILHKTGKKTKQYANLGKITYGECTEYSAYPIAQLAAADVTGIKDLLYKIPAALLQTKTVAKLVPWLESQNPIRIGEKIMAVVR